MAEYVVQRGVRKREPHLPVRVVAEDGTAWHVIRADRPNLPDDLPRLSFDEAINVALRRAALDDAG